MKKIFLMLVLICLSSVVLAEGWFSIGNDVKCRKFCTEGKYVMVCSNKYVMTSVLLRSCNSKVAVEQKGINFIVLDDKYK